MGKVKILSPADYIIEYFLAPLNISIEEFIENIHVDNSKIIGVLNKEYPVTEEIAIALSHYLGCSVGLWLGLQESYNERMRGEVRNIPVCNSEEAEVVNQ